MNHHFFAMLSRMKYIFRWSLMRNTRTENICEHTQEVMVIAHALALLHNKRFGGSVNVERCVLLSMYHDVTEILTGDLPTPVKYNDKAIRDEYRRIERLSAERLLSQLPPDLEEEYRPLLLMQNADEEERKIVKAADKLSALIKCIEEFKAGNNEFREARVATEKSLREMNFPAVQSFMDEFLPSYELTLDEQK
ncbi:MAG: 5'-deoxynucleotidase [Clostridia bacterium]|nr:5'-deoxynucleotidase [Clostridia bacterium]